MHAAIIGNIVADVIGHPIDLRHSPEPGTLTRVNSVTLTPGGSVCNVGLAMARLGMNVAGVGLVGDDVLGRVLLQHLRAGGVDTSFIQPDSRAQTSATIVAVEPGGERCFFHTGSVTRFVDPTVFRCSLDLFRMCRWIHIAYLGLLPALTHELPDLLQELKQAAPETRISLDTAHPPCDRTQLDRILPHVDLFAPSRPEAIALTGEHDPARMIASFRARMPQGIVGIKLDRDGCYLDDTASSIQVPAYPVEVVDTTGAGDCWFAGLLTGLLREMSLKDSARLANRVAADCCTQLGASAGVKDFADSTRRI